jgi:hypothetical protein
VRVCECVILLGVVTGCASSPPAPPAATPANAATGPVVWKQHDEQRPQPPVARPVGAVIVPPPADATVLFDGRSLDSWSDGKSGAARWQVENGYMEVVPGTGGIQTRATFGDAQLHIEWATPVTATGEGQNRANSGVFFMGRYEVQVLDSYGNATYPDGAAGAIYGQFPPLANASLPPGEWQSYDIIFRAPRFAGSRVASPARITVIHNGVVVQESVELLGPTSHGRRAPYEPHADRLPISLQDHGQPLRFRNIWVRELGTGE